MFNHIIIGGTFDRLHKGHKKIIDTAFKKGRLVTIGLTQKSLYKNKPLAQTIEGYQIRKKGILNYLEEKKWTDRAEFIPIVNFYGTTLADKTIDAIVVSSATKKNAQIINKKRETIGFAQLEIIVVPDVLAEDGNLITSERIRFGEIDRAGNVYDLLFKNNKQNKKELILPESLREALRKPMGKIISSFKCFKTSKYSVIISVGDVVTQNLLQANINPDVKIIDFKTKREKIPNSYFSRYEKQMINLRPYINKPGTINLKTVRVLKEKINQAIFGKKKSWIVIDGEEDMLALPAVLLAPLNSLVFYGHWSFGAVEVHVTEISKNETKNLVLKLL